MRWLVIGLVGCGGVEETTPISPWWDDDGRKTFHRDADGDGFGKPSEVLVAAIPPEDYVTDGTDCDDTDPTVHPGAEEYCDDIDHDCAFGTQNDAVDAELRYEDLDGDGHGGAPVWVCDRTGTTFDSDDCDDTDSTIGPEGWPWVAEPIDEDGDGYSDESAAVMACTAPTSDHVLTTEFDCDDTDPAIYPGAPEICNDDVDDDCDPLTREDWIDGDVVVYVDLDGDGFAPYPVYTLECLSSYPPGGCLEYTVCEPGPWEVEGPRTDCDDYSNLVFPGAPERCNGVDDDCDGAIDEDC